MDVVQAVAADWRFDPYSGEVADGYVYYVSLKGVTGAGHLDTEAVARAMPRIKAHVKVPVGVGFGIRDGASAKAVAQVRVQWTDASATPVAIRVEYSDDGDAWSAASRFEVAPYLPGAADCVMNEA